MTLADICRKVGCAKIEHHSYIPVYEELFAPLRYREDIQLLEVGVDSGNSLRLWAEYFPSAYIFGIDITPSEIAHPRVKTYTSPQEEPSVAWPFTDEQLDVIIDDAGHFPDHQRACQAHLWPKLKPGGLYIIEDLPDVRELLYWGKMPGFRCVANFRDGLGNFREDDVMVILRK